MDIKCYNNFKSPLLKEHWNQLYKNNAELSPFQSFDFVFNYYKNMKWIRFKHQIKPYIYEFSENGKTLFILPLWLKRKKFESFDTLDYSDLIYDKDVSNSKIHEGISLIKNELEEITFFRVHEKSRLFEILSNSSETLSSRGCAKISFGDDYDNYYSSLSKNARQNIRTAYNRLNKDFENVNIELKFIEGILDKKTAKMVRKIYQTRRKNQSKSKLAFLKYFIRTYFHDTIASTFQSATGTCSAILYINGEIASFFQGLISNDQTIVVPRLALNEKYQKYSAGILLINESIKFFIKNNITQNLDLALGDEPYKFVMGGTPSSVYNFKLKKA